MTITISGDLGSGKSTVSHLLSALHGLVRYSTGDVQRKLAADRGMTSLEFNRLAETDPEIDRLIDQGTADLAKQESRVVFDSRLAWYFVEGAYRIYLSVDPHVAANRVLFAGRGATESYDTMEEASQELRARRASELLRFQHYYGIQLDDLSNYDLVLDSTFASAERIAELVPGDASLRGVVVSPKVLIPVAGIAGEAIEVVRQDGHYFLVSGRAAVSAALRDGLEFVTGQLAKGHGVVASDSRLIAEWEAAHGFRFASYPAI
jgi:cytidylate kinase